MVGDVEVWLMLLPCTHDCRTRKAVQGSRPARKLQQDSSQQGKAKSPMDKPIIPTRAQSRIRNKVHVADQDQCVQHEADQAGPVAQPEA